MATKYSFWLTIWKGIRRALQYGLPFLLGYLADYHPAVLSLTIGSVIEMLINWAKNKDK